MLKVLIADDEQMICSLISNLMDWEEMGFEIVGMANTGIDAYNIIVNQHPDVVITDIRMPGYDGIELIKKTDSAGISTVFVMISGFRQFEYAQNAMQYGVKYYILKPIDADELKKVLMEIRQEKDAEHERILHENNLNHRLWIGIIRTNGEYEAIMNPSHP